MQERVRAKPASPCRKGPRMAAPAAKEEHPNTQTERKLPAAQMRPAKGQPVKKARLDHDADLQLRLNSALASGKPKAKPVGSLKQGKGPAPASQSRGFVAAPSAKGNIAAPPKAAAYGQGGTQEKGTAAPAPSAAKVVDGNVHLLVKSVAEGSKDGSAGLNVSKKPATGEAASERAATVSVPESNGSTAHMGESRGDIGRVQATLSSGKDKPAPAHSNGEVPSAGEQPNSAKVADPSERSEAPRAAVQADHALKRHTIHMEAAGLGKGDVSLAVKGSEQPGVKSVPIKEPAAPPKAAGVSHHQETTPKETGETAVAALVGVKPEQRLNSALPALQPKAAPLQSVKWKLASNSAPAGVGPTNVAGRVSPGGDSNSALGVASSTPVEGKAARDSTSTVAAKPGSRSSNHQGSRVFANVPEQAGGDSKGSNRVAAKVELAGPRGGKPDKRHARIVWDAQVAARNAETRVEGRTNGSRGRMGDGKPIAAEVRAPVQPVAVMEELGADFLALPD